MDASAETLTYNQALEIRDWDGEPHLLLQKYVSNPDILDILPLTSRNGMSIYGLFFLLQSRVKEYLPDEIPNTLYFEGSKLTFERVGLLTKQKNLTVGDYKALQKLGAELIQKAFPMDVLAELYEPAFDVEHGMGNMTWDIYVKSQVFITRAIIIHKTLELQGARGLRRWVIKNYLKAQKWRLPR